MSDRQSEIARELGTGTRLTQLSNDPLAAAATVRLSSQVAQASATISAIQTVQARMQTADSALGSVITQLTSAISVAVGAANDTSNAQDRASAAVQLSSIRDAVLNLANSSYNGTYLFGGTVAGATPFTRDDTTGDVTYSGDANSATLTVQGKTVPTSASGTALFGDGSSGLFAQLQDVITALQSGQAPTAVQISGIRRGLQGVIDGRSALASSAKRLQDASSYTATQQTNLQAQQTAIAGTDPVALATELSNTQTQRSALLSSLAALGKNSLFDYLPS
ncbi:flagellin [Terriglobus sp.]|uniref:flagellin N-terminal helical domain-containing protein n=1 Tax=Terriglobus sp. TaxID=1889013 RepID=UPI003B00A5DB